MQHIFDNAQVTDNALVTDNARVFGNAWVAGEANIMSDTDWTMIDTLTVYRSRCADGYEIRNDEGELVSVESLTDAQRATFFDWFSRITGI